MNAFLTGVMADARHDGRPCRYRTRAGIAAGYSHAGLTAPKAKADDDRKPIPQGRARQRTAQGT